MEPSDKTAIAVEVPDDSILASKTLTIRPIRQMKLKHLRAFQRVVAAGRSASMDDMARALAGALVGWTDDEINELTLDEMLLIIGKLGEQQQAALPNERSSSSPPPSAPTTRRSGRTGSKR